MSGHCNERRAESGDELGKISWASSKNLDYSRSATEHRPAGDRCGRVQMNMDMWEVAATDFSLSTRHDDDEVLRPTAKMLFTYKKVGF